MYIGKIPTVGNFQICDAISVVDAQAAYTMQVDTVDVSPESANHMIVSLNGVIQKPTDAYTVSGSTITFASNLVTGDVIDFIQILGNVLDLGVPSDATVSTAKIVDANVTTAKIADANVTAAKMFSGFANGITSTDQYRLTANLENPGSADITANIERADDATFGRIGTGMSVSSGIYTFPSTGIWRIQVIGHFYDANGDDGAASVDTLVSSDSGSNYDILTSAIAGNLSGSQSYNTHPSECFVDVTNASNFRVKFRTDSMTATILVGSSNQNVTSFSFIRLGDT
jgi:hypothetical protein